MTEKEHTRNAVCENCGFRWKKQLKTTTCYNCGSNDIHLLNSEQAHLSKGRKLEVFLCLTTEQKKKLIEILLLVGAILAAFNLPAGMIWIFMLFAIFSVIYYILLSNGKIQKPEFKSAGYIFSIIIATAFAGVVTYTLAINAVKGSPKYGILMLFMAAVYYIAFAYCIHKALKL